MVSATPAVTCRFCGIMHASGTACERFQQIENTLELLGVPGFLTDPVNRIVRVNREFARLVGDPDEDGVPSDTRFIHLLVIGPWRDRFERPSQLVADCLPALAGEIELGRLSYYARAFMDRTVRDDPDVRRALSAPRHGWDGTVVVRRGRNERFAVREQVTPVRSVSGDPTGFHISLWFPHKLGHPEAVPPGTVSDGAALALTGRQMEFARLFAKGLSHTEVAASLGVSPSTARTHLEDIYSKLGVHSRAEMVTTLLRDGVV